MTEAQPAPAGSGVSTDVAELDRALTRIAYLLTRNRRNGLTTTAAGVPLDRAAVTVLLELADSGAMRPGELAARLEVEAPHVTRQGQRLERAGYAARGADPDDRRAQLIQLTSSPPCSTAWSTTSWPTTPSKDRRPDKRGRTFGFRVAGGQAPNGSWRTARVPHRCAPAEATVP